MASIQAFGRYLPERVFANPELAGLLGVDPDWIVHSCGIEERRISGPDETVVSLGSAAARDCLRRAPSAPKIGLILVASGTSERRFPGPASEIAHQLGFGGIPAIDLPIASAGSLFGLTLAADLAPRYGDVLLVASEKMACRVTDRNGDRSAADKNVAILFGDGAGACLISPGGPGIEIVAAAIHSDGAFASELRLEFQGAVAMNGFSVIMQATRKLPAVIQEVLDRSGTNAESVRAFLMHQANQNLIDRVARAVHVPAARFYSNIRRYGNTSSASMLIAASEWHESGALLPGETVCFAAFGAGYHWGAVLARQT